MNCKLCKYNFLIETESLIKPFILGRKKMMNLLILNSFKNDVHLTIYHLNDLIKTENQFRNE